MYTLVVALPNQSKETYTTRSLNKAYKMYDNAIRQGYYIESFTNPQGKDMQDRQNEQSAIVYK